MLSDRTLRGLINDPDVNLVHVPGDRLRIGWADLRDSQIQPASVDVRLAEDLRLYDRSIDWDLARDGEFVMSPGECVLGSLVERVRVPGDMVGWVEGKSSIGRQFLKVHSAGFIDPGFYGDITLELKNESSRHKFTLKAGMMIAQLRFAYLEATVVRPYGSPGLNSHYQNQDGTTEAR